MKKLMLVGLLFLMAGVVFAQETFEFNGQLTYGFTANEDVVNRSFADAFFILKANLSPTAFAAVKVSGEGSDAKKDTLTPTLENIYAAQKLGPAWFEMGVMGNATLYYDPSDFGFGNLSYDPGAFEAVAVRYEGRPFNVTAWFNPTGLGAEGEARGVVNVWKPVGPLNVSLWYSTERDGLYGGSVGYTLPFQDAKLLGDVEYKHDVEVEDSMRWTTVNRIVYRAVEVGFDTMGDNEGFMELAGELTISPTTWLSSVNGVAYNVRDKHWDVVEIGGSVKWEKARFRFGYFITDNAGGGFSQYAPNPPEDGGIYLKVVCGW